MFRVVRIYASEEAARAAVEHAGEAFDTVGMVGPEDGSVDDGIKAGFIDQAQRPRCALALENGQWVVGVSAPFGYVLAAERALDRHDPVETVSVPTRSEPAPLSSALGIPVLSRVKSSTRLASSNRFVFGEPKPSKKAAPFSQTLGLPLLTKSQLQKSTFAMPLLTKSGAPFSSMFGMPTLTKSQKGKASLSNDPTPFSSILGLRVLSKDDDED